MIVPKGSYTGALAQLNEYVQFFDTALEVHKGTFENIHNHHTSWLHSQQELNIAKPRTVLKRVSASPIRESKSRKMSVEDTDQVSMEVYHVPTVTVESPATRPLRPREAFQSDSDSSSDVSVEVVTMSADLGTPPSHPRTLRPRRGKAAINHPAAVMPALPLAPVVVMKTQPIEVISLEDTLADVMLPAPTVEVDDLLDPVEEFSKKNLLSPGARLHFGAAPAVKGVPAIKPISSAFNMKSLDESMYSCAEDSTMLQQGKEVLVDAQPSSSNTSQSQSSDSSCCIPFHHQAMPEPESKKPAKAQAFLKKLQQPDHPHPQQQQQNGGIFSKVFGFFGGAKDEIMPALVPASPKHQHQNMFQEGVTPVKHSGSKFSDSHEALIQTMNDLCAFSKVTEDLEIDGAIILDEDIQFTNDLQQAKAFEELAVTKKPTLGNVKPVTGTRLKALESVDTNTKAGNMMMTPVQTKHAPLHKQKPVWHDIPADCLTYAQAVPKMLQTATPPTKKENTIQVCSEKDSDDEDEQFMTEQIPSWATTANLIKEHKKQRYADPDLIFPPMDPMTCDLDVVFKGISKPKSQKIHKRTSSGIWTKDQLTQGEIESTRIKLRYVTEFE